MSDQPYDGMGKWRKRRKKPPYIVEREGFEHVLSDDLDIELFASLMIIDIEDWLKEVTVA